MMKSLLDTDTLSEVLKWKDPIVAAKAKAYRIQYGRYAFSTITVTEVVKGFSRVGREQLIKDFLALAADSEVLTLDTTSAELAGRIQADLQRRGRPIGMADVLIAAIAIHHGLPLVTGNTAHHANIQEAGYRLVLENWRDSST